MIKTSILGAECFFGVKVVRFDSRLRYSRAQRFTTTEVTPCDPAGDLAVGAIWIRIVCGRCCT